MQTGLENKPWYFAALAGAVLGAVVAGLLYWQVSTAQQDTIRAQDNRIVDLERKITEGRAAEQKLPQFREEVRRLELELDKLLRILPARRNTPELLRRIRALAEQGDFDLTRFTPGAFSDRDFYSEWPIGIELAGSYHNLALFFDRIGRFSRIINIENLRIFAVRPQTPTHTIGATFTAKTFIYKEDAPPPPPAAAPAPKRKPAPDSGGGGD